jgi:Raf kinase inhibitor-like YbhB/YbcL family protein
MKQLKITSPAFENKGFIPSKYTCDGEDANPALKIEGINEGTQSLALIVDDPDASMGTWDHWIVWNIPPTFIRRTLSTFRYTQILLQGLRLRQKTGSQSQLTQERC